ncbi:39307_t:CDS:2 [Gigaspora margarita]|uniref:39307_t:CDS:1 n=1 Tax=Gigaspora margarita TaxID=4874 RepID=A0ABN7VZI0_GIGMA|nr:39307_t:CDS:2 [Gigaspora margarita]
MPYKESWLAPYMNNNINLDIRSTQHVESLHSKLKGVENHIIPIDKLLSIIWWQLQAHSQKLAYETFLHQNHYIQNKTDLKLKEIRLICSQYAFETFIKPQKDLAMIGTYKIIYENGIYNVIQIDSPKNLTYIYLHIHVPPNEVHKHWHVQQTSELEYVVNNVPLPVIQIFKQLPQCHYDSFLDMIQCALEHITENGKVPELLSNKNVEQKTIFRTINIDNVADDNKIIMPEVKHKCGHPPNNRCIRSTEEKKSRVPSKKAKNKCSHSPNNGHIHGTEEKENRVPLKKAKNNKMPHLNNVILDIHIPHDAVLEMHNPIGDRNCDDFYSNVLGYSISRLINVLSYMISGSSQEYWFYTPKCAQLVADTFNIPIIVFGTASDTSLLFLLFNQKPSYRKKPVILQ